MYDFFLIKTYIILDTTILSYCRLTNNRVMVNNHEHVVPRSERSWLSDMYRSMEISYPKFFKMDNLSKVGFLASEFLLKDYFPDKDIPKKYMSIVLMNSSSSLDNDRMYQETIQEKDNYYPSPAIFVYTLPNIVTGEIAIRNKIMGETSFYVSKCFSPEIIFRTVVNAFMDKHITHLVCGWVDYELNNCDVLLFLVSKESQKGIPFNVNSMYHLYH